VKPIHSAGQDDLSKRSPRGFGPKARHELLQKLREKGYLSEEEYTRHTEPIQSVDNGDSVVQTQGLKHPQLDEQPLDEFERILLLNRLRDKCYLSDEEFARYMWPYNEDQEIREWWLKVRKLYKISLQELNLSVQDLKSVKWHNLNSIGDLVHTITLQADSSPPLFRLTMPKLFKDLLQKIKDEGYITEGERIRIMQSSLYMIDDEQ
jgi:ribosomal protein S8